MKVLVATDRSDTARHAVAWAADFAGRFDGELVLLQVLPEGLRRICAVTRRRLRERVRWYASSLTSPVRLFAPPKRRPPT